MTPEHLKKTLETKLTQRKRLSMAAVDASSPTSSPETILWRISLAMVLPNSTPY
jgi:hypothetical protein